MLLVCLILPKYTSIFLIVLTTIEEYLMRLAYLVFAGNPCYCNVVEEAPKGVTVDVQNMTWRYEYAEFEQEELIGHNRYLGKSRGGVIGVYDLDSVVDIVSMVK
jgi:hypothetical protein